MARIEWDDFLSRTYEVGVSRVMIHFNVWELVPWNGVISITESPTSVDREPTYQDGFRTYNDFLRKNYQATISAYTYPERLDRVFNKSYENLFDISYVTDISDKGYKLHLVYDCTLDYTSESYSSLSRSIDPTTFSWVVEALPQREHDGLPTTSHFVIDSTKVSSEDLEKIEDILYGTDLTHPRFPTPFEIRYILGGMPPLEIVPTPETGLSPIIPSTGERDLAGNTGIGLYRTLPETRLREFLPGLNRME